MSFSAFSLDGSRLDPFNIEVFDLLVNNFVIFADADFLLVDGSTISTSNFSCIAVYHLPEDDALLWPSSPFHILLSEPPGFFAIFAACAASDKSLGLDHNTLISVGQFKRIIFHILARPAEYRVKQFFLGRKFGFALGHNLADQNVARLAPSCLPELRRAHRDSSALFRRH